MARLPRIGGMDTHLLESLVYEAEQCARAMDDLARLRRSLAPSQCDELLLTRERVGVCRSALLALADSFPLHAAQVFRILNHVDAALKCLGRTLRDLHGWCTDLSLSREERWRMMARAMLVEGKGRMTLEKRFRIYARFFECLELALCGSPVFDKFKAETLRLEIMDLRKARRIKLPKNPTTTFYPFEDPNPSLPPSRYLHWSEDILASPMPSSTLFEMEGRSESYGPFQAWDDLNIESYSQLLFRKTIKKDEMSLSLFLNPYDQRFHLLLRCNYKGRPYFSCRSVQDLHVTRSGGSGTTLHLSRWSVSQRGYKYWAVVHLGTYEADELLFTGEVRLWKAYILDNGFKHKLSLYEDKLTGARRLHAVPADGQLARCPAWTIFCSSTTSN
ncbi:hypothetical protein K4F52_008313 [Lecanicillium sp. MT-2017a]|nr:hypothetical protein K4F52_008313 [Lecanicillium sp. MT-2017a]